jgi:hypothetical protein
MLQMTMPAENPRIGVKAGILNRQQPALFCTTPQRYTIGKIVYLIFLYFCRFHVMADGSRTAESTTDGEPRARHAAEEEFVKTG